MQINRNNYESFFLLYADGELRIDECKAVDNFISDNEDLRIELDMLKATVLPVEELVFSDKSFLYKETILNKVVLEELLLKIDDELPLQKLEKLNATIIEDENVKFEFELLQRTKLDNSEKIIFEDKQLLYKKERDKVIGFRWVKFAAAAMLIGFGIFSGIKLFNKNENLSPVEITKNKISRDNINTPDTINIAKQNSIEPNKASFVNADIESAANLIDEIKIADKVVAQKQNNTTAKKANAINNRPTNKLYPLHNNEEKIVKNNYSPTENIIIPYPSEVSISIAQIEQTKAVDILNNDILPLEETYTKAIDIVNIERSENKILFLDEEDVKKTKIGGFFRKIKRFVERTAKIKPGNSLQIAGFEIASK